MNEHHDPDHVEHLTTRVTEDGRSTYCARCQAWQYAAHGLCGHLTPVTVERQVWRMTKAELVDEIDQHLAQSGAYVAYPTRAARLRWSKGELENECQQLREYRAQAVRHSATMERLRWAATDEGRAQ